MIDDSPYCRHENDLDDAPDPKNHLIVASVSGGKDSTAMALWLKEQGLDYRCVFADTGWEDRQTYDYLRDVLPSVIGPIDWVRRKVPLEGEAEALALRFEERLGHYSPMIRSCIKKGLMPSRVTRWCTTDLKVDPVKRYIAAIDDAVISAVGIRGEESARRAAMPAWEFNRKMRVDVWRPILSWTMQDVIDIHHRHGIRPNPKYMDGAERVGCWPCVFARKSEIKNFGRDSKRVAIVRDLEREICAIQARRKEEKGQADYVSHYTGWFYPHMARREGGWSIDKTIQWANTSRGGRQFELFAAWGEEAGCVRWGMCDTGIEGGEE